MNLKHLTDKALLTDTKFLVSKEREISLKVLHHLREIEKRRLFSDLGYGSLFEYATKELGYAESSASRRIRSARMLEDFPEIEKKLEDGSLTMSNVAMAALTFNSENITDSEMKKSILEQIENTSKRGCEKILLGFSNPNPLPREKEKLVTPSMFTVHWNLSEETMNRLNELKDLLAHKRLNQDQLLKTVFETSIDEIIKQKYKIDAKPRSPGAKPCTTRYIPVIVRKEVYQRDKGRCTRCRGTYKLEYDHVKPFAIGGESTLENLRLLCFSCNQRRIKTSTDPQHTSTNAF